MLPKIQFYLYIFKCNYWLKKRTKTHTHKKNHKTRKTNQPTHPQVPTNPEICKKQKRARNSYGPGLAYEA